MAQKEKNQLNIAKNEQKEALLQKQNDKKNAKEQILRAKKEQKIAKKQEKIVKRAKKQAKKKRIKELLKNKRLKEKEVRKAQEETIRSLEQRGKFASWFRLDNAASIYPSASDKDWNFVYRISVTMKNKVDKQILQKALDDIMPRFPTFNVKLCHG